MVHAVPAPNWLSMSAAPSTLLGSEAGMMSSDFGMNDTGGTVGAGMAAAAAWARARLSKTDAGSACGPPDTVLGVSSGAGAADGSGAVMASRSAVVGMDTWPYGVPSSTGPSGSSERSMSAILAPYGLAAPMARWAKPFGLASVWVAMAAVATAAVNGRLNGAVAAAAAAMTPGCAAAVRATAPAVEPTADRTAPPVWTALEPMTAWRAASRPLAPDRTAVP